MEWYDFDKFIKYEEKHMPSFGEGDTMASQTVTAINKLVFRFFNDGDVYDNTYYMSGWENNLSSYANWLAKYVGADFILDRIRDCADDEQYTEILYDLSAEYMTEEKLEELATKEKVGSIYECDGKYTFEEDDEDYDWEEVEEPFGDDDAE